jgi:hypothetical protein
MPLWGAVMGNLAGDTPSQGNQGTLSNRLSKHKAIRDSHGRLLKPGDKGYEEALAAAKAVQVGSKFTDWCGLG